jgi:acetoin utilization protein AcuB
MMQTHNETMDTQLHTLFLEEPLRVQDLMTTTLVTVTPDTSVHAARRLMQQRKIRHLPVLEHGQLVGIISDRLLRTVLPSPATSLSVWEVNYLLDRLTVGEVMNRFVMTVTPETLTSEAVSRMLGQQVGALPVVEGGRLVGILTRTDILRAFLRLQAEVPMTV